MEKTPRLLVDTIAKAPPEARAAGLAQSWQRATQRVAPRRLSVIGMDDYGLAWAAIAGDRV